MIKKIVPLILVTTISLIGCGRQIDSSAYVAYNLTQSYQHVSQQRIVEMQEGFAAPYAPVSSKDKVIKEKT